MKKENIVIIGMPGSGKTTIGMFLAKRMGYTFRDSDHVIQERTGHTLSELIAEHGIEGFWQIESDVNASFECERHVISTGGSAIYQPEGMAHLSEIGYVVYLKTPEDELLRRLGDLVARGVTLHPGQTFHDLFEERRPLYEKYAHITIDCVGKSIRQVTEEARLAVLKAQEED